MGSPDEYIALFSDEEIEAQKYEITWWRSHSR